MKGAGLVVYQIKQFLGRSLRWGQNDNENEPITADWLFTFCEIHFDRPEPYGFHKMKTRKHSLDVSLWPLKDLQTSRYYLRAFASWQADGQSFSVRMSATNFKSICFQEQ